MRRSPAPPRERAKGERSCGRLERRELDVLDLGDRQLQEAQAQVAKGRCVTGGQEAVVAVARAVVLDSLARKRLRDFACGFLRREDERDLPTEHALEDRSDQRI